jgi:hypothetical protein
MPNRFWIQSVRWIVSGVLFISLFSSVSHSVTETLPTAVALSRGPGQSGLLLVTLSNENAKVLVFALETGGSFTVFDRSLESALGQPTGKTSVRSVYGSSHEALYKSPKLFLGNVPIRLGREVITMDLSRVSAELSRISGVKERLSGLLGMNCLQNYCLQIDFKAGELRFLDPDRPVGTDCGRAFQLSLERNGISVRDNLIGLKGAKSYIDTGCNFDGVLTPALFRRWTNQTSPKADENVRQPNSLFGGQSYRNLWLHGDGEVNLIGLGFLSRHLVTFNFPRRIMYLKRTDAGGN